MIDATNWSFLQSIEEIEVGRYFEYDEDALTNFRNWLHFLNKLNMKVLEIGSGTGFFTSKLKEMFPSILLNCLEPDPNFSSFLNKKFKEKIPIINETIENNTIKSDEYDCIITHIVIHNLANPFIALKEMKRVTKQNGYVVVIEPLATSRHYYPNEEISKAYDFLDQVIRYRCMERNEKLEIKPQFNPWNHCYPQLMEKTGLKKVRCYGWTSIFTLSDTRYDFETKKAWLKRRHQLVKNQQLEITNILLKNNHKIEEINNTYEVILNYLTQLDSASKNELEHIHEQEIVHRIVAIGQKMD